jgi:hypothetical protein
MMEEIDGWTLKSLKALMDERDRRYTEVSDAKEKAVSAALVAAQKAVDIAEHNAEKWREGANEWRQAMTDKDRNFVTKNVLWGYFVGVIGLMIALMGIMQKMLR